MSREKKHPEEPAEEKIKAGKSKRGGKRKGMCLDDRPILEPNAAGIDIGAREIFVAVPPDRDEHPVRVFSTFTEDLEKMALWLVECGITTVAMESTGVYWIPPYNVLEQHGVKPCLVDARGMKNVPGRRTDWHECQWLQFLHSVGLLRAAFRPAGEVCAVRSLMRRRAGLVEMTSQHIQHMHKALTQMNVQIQHVISDITGLTGLAIVDAILEGQRDPATLAKLRDPRIKATEATVAKSLEGNWRPELLFVLQQEQESYESFQTKIAECDGQLKRHYATLEPKADATKLPPVPRDRRAKGNVPAGFDLREEMYRATGVDLTAIDGVNVLTVQTLISEVGWDMSRFATEAHLVSFLGLSPRDKISGGKVVGREKKKNKNRAGVALKLAAGTLLNSDTYLGAQYRRLRTKLGAPKARKAMANRLARIAYRMLKYGEQYVDRGKEFYEQKYRALQIRLLTKKATELGLQLVQSA